jgi:hypothetical protein
MKKIISSLLISFLFITLSCDNKNDKVIAPNIDTESLEKVINDPMYVDADKASYLASRASAFYSRKDSKSGKVESKRVVRKITMTENGIPYYHIFEFEKEGWVIISSDRRMMPVLAFSEVGNFILNDKPIGLQIWEKTNRQIIKELRKSNSAVSSSAITSEWTTMECIPDPVRVGFGRTQACHSPNEFVSQTTIGPLLQTTWNQGCSYNSACPIASGGPCGHAYTGCVATAMAQIIKYYQYPSGYNYVNMPNNSGNGDIAQLMSSAGLSVGMSYGSEGSAAYMNDIDDALRNTFHYSSATYTNYSAGTYSTVMSNLYYGRPSILGGCNDQSTILGIPYSWDHCHAWVCDGFQQTNYAGYSYLMFHMNWGWGGFANGWFQFNNWNINGANLNFQYNQDAIIDIHP